VHQIIFHFFNIIKGSGSISFSSLLFNGRTEADRETTEKGNAKIKTSCLTIIFTHRFSQQTSKSATKELLQQIFPKKRKEQAEKQKATGLRA